MTAAAGTALARDLRARRRARERATNALVYAVLIALAIVSVYPFLWTLATSFETSGGIFEFPPSLIPNEPSTRNYAEALNIVPILRQALNSLIICAFGVGGSVLLATLGAYPLAKMQFPGRDVVFFAILGTLVLPNEAGLIVNYITSKNLGLLAGGPVGLYAAIILPGLSSTIGLFLMRQAYLSIPAELLEAARLDGASELLIWRRIMLPLTLPTISAFAILQFVALWNSFLWPSIVLRDRELYPLSAGLLDLAGAFSTNTRAVSAGAVLQIIPIILVFLFFQRYFMRGLEGAVKG